MEKKTTTRCERILAALSHLKMKGLVKTQQDVADMIFGVRLSSALVGSLGLFLCKFSCQPTCKAAQVHGFDAAVALGQVRKTLQVPDRLITLAVGYHDHWLSSLMSALSLDLLPSSSRVLHWISVR